MPAAFRKRGKETHGASASEDEGKAPAKRAKKTGQPVQPLDASVATNLTLPPTILIPAKPQGSTRLAAYNVAGLQACNKKGLRFYLEAEDPDIVVLTETKSDEKNEPEYLYLKQRFPYRTYGVDPKKGYSGTAILSKVKPLSVVKGLPTLSSSDFHSESRIVTLEFENTYVVGTYVPNAGEKLKSMAAKEQWNNAFEPYLRELDAKKPVIWCGDINCALTDKDIRNAKTNWNKTAGYTESECSALERQLNPPADSGHKKLVDIWRHQHPDTVGHYSYYSFRKDCRTKGIGWRLDCFIISERLVERAIECSIRQEIYGPSDHVPIALDIRGAL